MKLVQIWKYPVKSMLGARVPSAELSEDGVVGDRQWAIRDELRGAIASGRKLAGLNRLAASPATSGDGVTITLPDGTAVTATDVDANERLSAAIGHPVTLWSKPPATQLDHWQKGTPDSDDMMTEVRGIFGRLEDEPLPDFSIFPPAMFEYEYTPGHYYDCFPLMIMTTSAIRSLQAALPDSAVDERRFRPSLVIDTGDADGHPEFDWSGRTLRIGATELTLGAKCPRCVVVTREFGVDLPADRQVLRHIVRDLDQNVGIYATVSTAGPINVGDSVEFV